MSVLSVLLVFFALVVTADPANIFQEIGDSLTKEFNAVKQPIVETMANITFSQCDNVKKLLGLEYSQMEKRDEEPDLNKLSLIYVTKEGNETLDFNTALKVLPKSPDFITKPLVIYMHGFIVSTNKKSIAAITQGFLSRETSYTILALDSSSMISFFYLRSTAYVSYIGAALGNFLNELVKVGLPHSAIHLLGHSLGAHIAAYAAQLTLKATGRRVGRISGMDPAGPCFVQLNSTLKLDPSDADFVDVIHGNGGVFGTKDPIGQVDYYPNEGEQQPGCPLDPCSHSRAWELYAESLHSDHAFPAVRCYSWEEFKKGNCSETSYMGIASEPGNTGKYYLQTRSTAPYSLGENGTHYVNNEGLIKNLFD